MRVKGIFIFTTTAVYENTVNLCNGSSQNVPVLVKSVISEYSSSTYETPNVAVSFVPEH